MKTLCDRVEAVLRVVLCVILTAMTLTVVWQVLTRFLAQIAVRFNLPQLLEPSRWTEELAGFELGWLALLGAAYAYRKREHLGFDYLYLKMTPAGQRRTDLLVHSLVVIFSTLVLVYGGFRLVLLTVTLRQTTAALGWPMGLIYAVIPLSGLLITLFAIEQMVEWSGPQASDVEEAAL